MPVVLRDVSAFTGAVRLRQSTLLKLLIIVPASGSFAKEPTTDSMETTMFAYVPQDVTSFVGSIRSIVAFGDEDRAQAGYAISAATENRLVIPG